MGPSESPIQSIDAVTLAVSDMARSVAFYEALGFRRRDGSGAFTTLHAGAGYLNLQLDPAHAPVPRIWGRVIFFVDDVDAQHRRALDAGLVPDAPPADAPWGERYFHLTDPDGHELSFARPLAG
jgi:catechol 2,3-dioxygenase-like lactoylglutathione lyase family enzyme